MLGRDADGLLLLLQNGPFAGATAKNDSTSQLQSAAAVGKQAWMPGTTSEAGDAAVSQRSTPNRSVGHGRITAAAHCCGIVVWIACQHESGHCDIVTLIFTRHCKTMPAGCDEPECDGRRAAVQQALRAVKGILNKLTPEKFDRLLAQIIENVKSVDVLNGLIKLVFENAVR